MTHPLELVVARYREDLRWTRRVPPACRVTVYDKGGGGKGPGQLPNVGREAHSYLHHIVTHYDELADVTVFCQGRPFDHEPRMQRILRFMAGAMGGAEAFSPPPVPVDLLQEQGFLWLGFIIDCDDRTGSRLFQRWVCHPGRRPLDMTGFWHGLWDGQVPEEFVFYPGAQFMVTASRIRNQPRSFYERALALSRNHPDVGHCFERCWDRVFGVDGIPHDLCGGQWPVYLRPIRRLGTTWNSVPERYRGW